MTSSWVSSSFNEDLASGMAKKRGGSSLRNESFSLLEHNRDQDRKDSWVDKHYPLSRDKLAVHKKKIEEVEWWLTQSLKKNVGSILLLTGPSGSGKTSTIKVLAKELGAEVREWINPVSKGQGYSGYSREDYREEGSFKTQQVQGFLDFLLRASRFNPVCIHGSATGGRKLLLVEDMPNILFLMPDELHSILRRYKASGKCPVVFIVTDAISSDSSSRMLFPKKVQEECSVYSISFNPVSQTAMVKALDRIIQLERASCHSNLPSKDTLLSIAESSGGDIRSAVYTLQFSFQKGVGSLQNLFITSEGASKSKTRKKGEKNPKQHAKSIKKGATPIGGRDISMFLFRALGKVLHCKRLEEPSSDIPKLPDHLSECERFPPISNPDEIFQRTQVSTDSFSMFLQENYLDFVFDIDSAVIASGYLSASDSLKIWEETHLFDEISASVAIRGIMFSNKGGYSVGWRSHRKPHWYTVLRESKSRFHTSSHFFATWNTSKVDVVTELIPFLSIINTPLGSLDCCAFVQELGRFQGRSIVGTQGQLLQESDPCGQNLTLHDDFSPMSNRDNEPALPRSDSEEEYMIEDYDD